MKALVLPEKIKISILVDISFDKNGYIIPSTGKNILIGYDEDVYRVIRVEKDEDIFTPAMDWLWIDCPEDCTPDKSYYKDGKIYQLPKDAFVLSMTGK